MTLKHLRVFLGHTGYYKKCVHHYGKIAKPLTDLLKKNAFQWTPSTEKSFTELKNFMCTTPILVAHDFNKTIVVESYDYGIGIGTILTQDAIPLAFTSQELSGRNLERSTYKK
jgi:hypothetical protein